MNDQTLPPDPPEAVKLYQHLPSSMRSQSLMLIGIFTLLVFYTLYFTQDVLVPIFIAILFNLLLSPVVLRLRRLGLPYYLGAAVVVAGLAGAVGAAGYALSGPAVEWVERAPQSLRDIEKKVRSLKKPMQEMSQASKQVEQLTTVDPAAGAQPKVTIQQNSLPKMLAVSASTLLAQTVIVIVLLYFLLASGDLFMRRFVKALSSGQEKRRAVEIAHQMQKDVSLYLATVTAINSGLGVITGWPCGGWLWGIAGALLAVPLLVTFKIFADHIESLSGVSIFLGRREEDQ